MAMSEELNWDYKKISFTMNFFYEFHLRSSNSSRAVTISKNVHCYKTDGFHMEKSFTEREFQTNYNVNVEKVSYKSLMHRGWILRSF